MSVITRKSKAVWAGDLRSGKGKITTGSRVLFDQPYDFTTRFENAPGTNPEELIAAAHAACFNMAFAGALKRKGYDPQSLESEATCTLKSKESGGFEITMMELHVRGRVADIDETTFKQVAKEADQGCPVSNLLRCGLEIKFDVVLL